jgi:hypothetical protein
MSTQAQKTIHYTCPYARPTYDLHSPRKRLPEIARAVPAMTGLPGKGLHAQLTSPLFDTAGSEPKIYV